MTTIDTPEGIERFRQLAVAQAIHLYVKTRMRANRNYTPTNMLAFAGHILGKSYKRSQLEQAGKDLYAHLGMEWK